MSTAPTRWSLPLPVALAELQAPQTVTTEYLLFLRDGVYTLLHENLACSAQSLLHPPTPYPHLREQLTQPFQTPLKESEPPLCLTVSQVFSLLCNVFIAYVYFLQVSLAFSIPHSEKAWPKTNRHSIST